jgi:hypothetical protein
MFSEFSSSEYNESPIMVFLIEFLTFLGFGRGLHVTERNFSVFFSALDSFDFLYVNFKFLGGLKGFGIGFGVGSLF